MLLLSVNSPMPYPRMPVNLLPMTKTRSMLYVERPCDVDLHLLRLILILALTSLIANFFGRSLSQVTVCTTFSLVKPPPTVLTSFVRGKIYTCFPPFNIRSLNTLILIVVYLNMCNSLTITECFFPAAYCRFHALCFIFRVFSVILLNCVKVCDCHTYQ